MGENMLTDERLNEIDEPLYQYLRKQVEYRYRKRFEDTLCILLTDEQYLQLLDEVKHKSIVVDVECYKFDGINLYACETGPHFGAHILF